MINKTIPLRYLLFCLLLSSCNTSNNVSSNEAVTFENQQTIDDRSVDDLEEAFFERRNAERMKFVQADVDFMVGMIGHHAQALIMSAMAEPNNASQSVKILAARIINAQKDEIDSMQRWLAIRGQEVPQVEIDGLELIITSGEKPSLIFDEFNVAASLDINRDHKMNNTDLEKSTEEPDMAAEDHLGMGYNIMSHDHSKMPGMLTKEQLMELAAAKGDEFDSLFLRYMIQHHTGAITMVNDLINTDGAAQEREVGKLAAEINVDQITEIERMRSMLLNDF